MAPLSDVRFVRANDIDVGYFEMGDGPLALCLHGFPDTAHTWEHLLPVLADAGYHAVAPFLRGYAPTGLAPDGAYPSAALGLDANALHEVLGGGADAVIIGHDWGAAGTYAAVSLEPDRWRRAVTLAVPPASVVAEAFFSYDQLRLSWYMFFFQHPLSDAVVQMNDHEFVARLWADWSPGFDGSGYVQRWREAMPTPEHVTAALTYYRHTIGGVTTPGYDAATAAGFQPPSIPTLYLHGRTDGCMRVELVEDARRHLPAEGSDAVIVEGAGHFLHLERPEEVNRLILDFLAAG
jgi:pimeloyl-ACP methyl ester carboxylesterase